MNIDIERLTKSYGAQKAVDDISFSVHTGEILGFLGPNGAGKTTTMKMITNFIQPDRGVVRMGGEDVRMGNMKKNIGYLPEHNPLYGEMPMMEYLVFCARLQGVPRHHIDNRLRDMVRLCGLDREKHKTISELSQGYRQRVGLAQAMIHDPEVLIMDEPTTGLDPNQIVEIRELIKELGKEKTVILSTHILPEVEATCDRILIINRGRIVADGTSESLRSQARGKQSLKVRIAGAPVEAIRRRLQEVPALEEVSPGQDDEGLFELQARAGEEANRAVFNTCVEEGWMLLEMTPEEERLEDIFRNLTIN